MRQIKFRGKRVDNGEWVYGDLTHSIPELNTVYITYLENGSLRKASVFSESVGQFTGLKDKNGVEIYEGDILEHENGIKYIVVWIEQLAGWYLSIPNTQRGTDILSCAASQVLGEPIMLYKLTIIGNIHDKTPNNGK